MSINRNVSLALTVLLSMAVVTIEAVTLTVSKDGRGTYSLIQKAVDAAHPNDSVIILDAATYPEQVTIDSTKPGLTLASSNPLSLNKPKIVWQDTVDVGPKTCAEAKKDVAAQFDKNGAIRLLHTRSITINGIAVDGGGPKPFGWDRVWSTDANCTQGGCYGSPCPLFHGNSGIALWISGDITIRNCDLSNSYFGIAIKDRNTGGIFANANPADVQPWLVVPLSGFGKTGNHLFEYNRIHNNTWGFFTESIWDLGSTIRYNLIYENHHQSVAAWNLVKTIPDGDKSPGGCFRFKDHMLSPLSIYNNTFWHNSFIFIGDWQAGPQHLIFNNIYAQPFAYWNPDATNDAYMEMDGSFANRMHNCIYAAQVQAPQQYSVQIMNGFTVQSSGVVQQGALITAPFPASANVKWAEPTFQSTDPASTNFLVPDWTDTNVQKTIVDQGWVESGVKDPDGTIADLGAIPKGGGRPADLVTIKPTFPVMITTTGTTTTATLQFNVTARVGTMTNPVIKYIKYINRMVFQSGSWGATTALTPGQINTIAVPATPIKIGPNTLTVTIPSNDTSTYAFFELIIEGTGSDGKLFTTATGFCPYRKLDYKLTVEVWSVGVNSRKLDTVTVGDTVLLKLQAFKTATGLPFTNPVDSVLISLDGPGDSLYTLGNPPAPLTLIPQLLPGAAPKPVMFYKVPAGNIETISANGFWVNGAMKLPFPGSGSVYVKPGKPYSVEFQSPPSDSVYPGHISPTVYPGSPLAVSLQVYDKWGNSVTDSSQVAIKSLTPGFGDIVGGPTTITTNSTGIGTFGVKVTNGPTSASFKISATLLTGSQNTDKTTLVVGAPREKLWIFYSDTLAYAPLTTTLQGQVGDRLKITIIDGKTARMDSIIKVTTSITINGSTGLQFYTSPTATTPTTSFMLTNGRVDIWVTSLVAIDSIPGTVSASPDSVNTILPSDTRGNIYFIKPKISIDSAYYYADNAFGQVNRVEVYFKDSIAALPDSMALFWPNRTDADKLIASGAAITVAADRKHVTVKLATPFPAVITTGDTASLLGTTYQKATAGAMTDDTARFAIKERVGPLLMTAQVVENLTNTIDTLYVTFSEGIKPGSLAGASLLLIKNGVTSVDTVTAATLSGTIYKLTLSPGSKPPQLGDSLAINPAGPLADAVGNRAHDPNRPVFISQKSIPASVLAAYYQDRNADGTVETVVMKFNKKVSTSDCVIKLDWGGANKTDTIGPSLLSFVGTDSTTLQINVGGLFPGVVGPRTSGAMNATVGYRSNPDKTVDHDVADSAAPVLTLAVYHPGKATRTARDADTLWLDFSEPLGALKTATTFLLKNNSTGASYSIVVNTTALASTGTHRGFLVTSLAGVTFPSKGDSIWIDADTTVSRISDVSNSVQLNPNNRKVALDVLVVPYDVEVQLSANPFTPGTPINMDFIKGNGIAIEVTPITPMMDNIVLSAKGRIYDEMGNLIMDETVFQKNASSNKLYLVWDGRNRNGRYVGTGTYLALISWIKDNKISNTEKRMIGVKR